jgi:branched-chain amino acid transport system ATP-binding protein
VTVLHQGDVFREGPAAEIKADPEVRRIYLGSGGDS